MKRRSLAVIVATAIAMIAPIGARAADVNPPLPDPNFATTLQSSPCSAEPGNDYEATQFRNEGWADPDYVRYPGACQRLHFKFGPIVVKPGQNDVLIQPVTIEKPAYDGYITRFSPNLVRADGSIPPIEQVHLHHGTWLNFGKEYGSGPFFASGEEKTIGDTPRGYGFPISGSDTWQLLYMVHNLTANPDTVWITYDVDYIAKDVAENELHLKAAYPIWLDVRNGSSYPVFNVQRKYADANGTCTWPTNNCADFDPWGKASFPGQGQAGLGEGKTYRLPDAGAKLGQINNFTGGTIILVGGHLHPGGLNTDLYVKRNNVSQRVFSSTATYWDWNNEPVGGGVPGGPPTSWDLSMSTIGLPQNWAVHVKPGDKLLIDATYDAKTQATYENMGIMIALLAPDDASGNATVPQAADPFTTTFDQTKGCTQANEPANTLCIYGSVTHGHMAEAGNHGGGPMQALTGNMASHTDHVAIADFTYAPGDLGTIDATGIPTVSLGSTLTFANVDAAADIYHTVTSCANPCTGSTGIAYPLSDAKTGLATLDFDSAELGFDTGLVGKTVPGASSLSFGPAKNEITWDLPINASSGFASGNVYTYFCRIHPSMRGAFAVE